MGLSEEDLENMPEEKAATTGISEQILATHNGLGATYVLIENIEAEQPLKDTDK